MVLWPAGTLMRPTHQPLKMHTLASGAPRRAPAKRTSTMVIAPSRKNISSLTDASAAVISASICKCGRAADTKAGKQTVMLTASAAKMRAHAPCYMDSRCPLPASAPHHCKPSHQQPQHAPAVLHRCCGWSTGSPPAPVPLPPCSNPPPPRRKCQGRLGKTAATWTAPAGGWRGLERSTAQHTTVSAAV